MSDTKRIKNLSKVRDEAELDLKDAMERYRSFPGDGDFKELMAIDDETAVAHMALKQAQEDIKSAPFSLLKLLQAAGPQKKKSKKRGRGALMTPTQGARIQKIIKKRRR